MSKKIKKEIKVLASKAYEEELRAALGPLSEKFEQWKVGEFASTNLVGAIHEFHKGEAREIFNRYHSPLENLMVARAIVEGILKEEGISPEILKALEKELAFIKDKA